MNTRFTQFLTSVAAISGVITIAAGMLTALSPLAGIA